MWPAFYKSQFGSVTARYASKVAACWLWHPSIVACLHVLASLALWEKTAAPELIACRAAVPSDHGGGAAWAKCECRRLQRLWEKEDLARHLELW